LIENTDQPLKGTTRSRTATGRAHADFTYDVKYGIRDHRGGGRSSARETAMRVGGGCDRAQDHRARANPGRPSCDDGYRSKIRSYNWGLGRSQQKIRSSAPMPRRGVFRDLSWTPFANPGPPSAPSSRIVAEHVPPGWGAPIYGKLDAELAGALMSINAVKGVEIGDVLPLRNSPAKPMPMRCVTVRRACRIFCQITRAASSAGSRPASRLSPVSQSSPRPRFCNRAERSIVLVPKPKSATKGRHDPASESAPFRLAKRWLPACLPINFCAIAGKSGAAPNGLSRHDDMKA